MIKDLFKSGTAINSSTEVIKEKRQRSKSAAFIKKA